MKTITSRSFNQDVGGAKRMAKLEPVVITDRGKPSHVLMSHDEFKKLRGEEPERGESPKTLFDIFSDPRPEADFDWEPPRWGREDRKFDLG